jgi:hypothetical protein
MNKVVEKPVQSPEHLISANSAVNAWSAPTGPSASVDYLIAKGIDRNPVMMAELYPDRVIPAGLASPKIENKASLSRVFDEKLMYNPVFESKIRSANITPTTPIITKSNLGDITLGQALELEGAWTAETGEEFPAYSHSREKFKQDRAHTLELNDDLPPFTVNDDEVFTMTNDTSPVEPQDNWGTPGRGGLKIRSIEKKKLSRRKKFAIGAVALASMAGISALVAAQYNDSNSEEAPVTEEAPDSGIDFSSVTDSFKEVDEAEKLENSNNETPSDETTVGEASSTNSTQEALQALNADEIAVSGDVMPSTNVSNAGSENHTQSIQAGLEIYNQVAQRNFALGMGDMFWEGDSHIITRDELADYNLVMKLSAEGLSVEEIKTELSKS